MDTGQPETPPVLLPVKQRLAGEQRLRAAAALDFRRAPAGRGNEVHPRHQHAPRVFFAEQDGSSGGEVHEGRAEGAREALALGPHQIDVGLAVDLRAAKKENVDAPLACEVEELPRALRERIGGFLLLPKDPEAAGLSGSFAKNTPPEKTRRRPP